MIIGGLLAASLGCQSAPKRIGKASVSVLPPSAPEIASSSEGSESESTLRTVYVPARARFSYGKPAYPDAALKAGAPAQDVYVTVTVDEHGKITDVRPTWSRITLKTSTTELFLDAVKATILKWEMEPARLVYWQKSEGGEYRYLRTETTRDQIELKFSFEAPIAEK